MNIVGFYHGIDPATQGDFYTDVVHVLPEKPKLNLEKPEERFKWLPFLVHIVRLRHRDPNEIIDHQIRIFNKFPPMLVKIDSSREDFLANALMRKYGESKIIPVKFGNVGSTNTKFHLKQVGYSYINAGYQWPPAIELEKTQPRFAKLIKLLKQEMMHEQVEYTDTGRVTFRHPTGNYHNDLVHGWELSLDAVMQFQQKNLGYELRKIGNQKYPDAITEEWRKRAEEEDEDDDIPLTYSDRMFDRLYGD